LFWFSRTGADQESGCQSFEIAQQVSTALGRLFRYVEKSWIFDNEIDWVLRITRIPVPGWPQGWTEGVR